MHLRLVALTFLLLASFALVPAQSKNLTLDEVIRIALDSNVTVIQAQNNLEATESNVMASYGRYLPFISGGGGWTRYQNEGQLYAGGIPIPGSSATVTSESFTASLNASLTLFDGFDREANVNRANAVNEAGGQTVKRTRQSIVFQVQSAYLNVLRLEQLVQVAQENLKRDNRQLERITESNRVGALSLADVYRQQSQVASDELLVINAQNNYGKSKADLVALIGLSFDQDYQFSDPSLSVTIDTAEVQVLRAEYSNRAALTSRALSIRPDYLGFKNDYEASSSSVTSAKSNYWPSLSAFAGLSSNEELFGRVFQPKSFSWGVRLNWTIFDGFGTNMAVQNAIAGRRNAEITVAQAERNISVEVRKAQLDLDAAVKQYDVSQKGVLSASEDRKIAEERYNLGAGTLLDLLTANAGLVNAQANHVNASYNYIIAKRNMEYVLGERIY